MTGKLRQWIKLLVATAFYRGGGFRLVLRCRARQGSVCVLGLHRILDETQKRHSNSQDSIVLDTSAFEQMLAFLQRYFRLLTVSAMLRDSKQPEPGPGCVITFDDGWEDNYSQAYPRLKEAGMPATIFLTTALLEGGGPFWVERLRAACAKPSGLYGIQQKLALRLHQVAKTASSEDVIEHLKHMPAQERQELLRELLQDANGSFDGDHMLTWDQVRQMSRDGIELGSHTDTHPLLPYEQDAAVESELRVSKQKIERAVQRPVKTFAYPNGDWDERVRQRVRDARYECAFTTRPGWFRRGGDPYTVPRILLHDGNVTGPSGKFSSAVFSLTLMGWR
jgi:peptidoglycan/xylan/chitin deacetylase (PgdA/CDA1 family)